MKRIATILAVTWAVLALASGSPVLAGVKVVDPYKPSPEQQLRQAAHAGELAGIKALLNKGARINDADEEGWTALMWATLADEPEAVKLLLDRGADVNAKDKLGRSALYWAAMEGNAEIMEILLARGADVNAKEKKRGWTPLMRAVVKGRSDAVEMLLANGADPNTKDRKGNSPLALASLGGFSELTRTLTAKGAVADPKAQKLLAALENQALTAQTFERSTIVQVANGPAGGSVASRNVQAAEITLVGPNAVETATAARAAQVQRVERPVVPALNRQAVAAPSAKLAASDFLRAGENLLQGAMGASSNRRTAIDGRARAENLLRQAVNLWDQLRRDHPDVAEQLLQSAQKPVSRR
ncbi:MAG: ankyrin repeat domain-containing protein [Desulfomonile sp.]|nr:ankyrin repeat domain-containing protein [Desulfomonile sp.]